MVKVSFENPQAKLIYTNVLSKAPLKKNKGKIEVIFENQAKLDGNLELSEKEAKEAEYLLNKYDQITRYQIGIYNEKEIDYTLHEIELAGLARFIQYNIYI